MALRASWAFGVLRAALSKYRVKKTLRVALAKVIHSRGIDMVTLFVYT